MSIFEYMDYKTYLRRQVAKAGQKEGERPSQAALARAAGCQPAYLSQVLRGDYQLSLEQAAGIAERLGLSSAETSYLFLLVQHQRAGTPRLKQLFRDQIAEQQRQQKRLKYRLPDRAPLSGEARGVYFSQWYYAAVHLAVQLPTVTSLEGLCRLLGLGRSTALGALEFLETNGLITRADPFYAATSARFHLEDDSPFVSSHHTNWRLKVIDTLKRSHPRELERDLHYSSVVTLSEEDAAHIRSRLLEEIALHKQTVRDSPPRRMYGFLVDFFAV